MKWSKKKRSMSPHIQVTIQRKRRKKSKVKHKPTEMQNLLHQVTKMKKKNRRKNLKSKNLNLKLNYQLAP